MEDYAIDPVINVPLIVSNGSDFDNDNDVDGFDFLAWQRGFGQTNGAAAADGDANGDGAVNDNDLAEWQTDFDDGGQLPLVVESADFDTDGDVDGSDFLDWQRGTRIVSGALQDDGDANHDGKVNQADLDTWEVTFGTVSGSAAAQALVSSNSESASFVAASLEAAPLVQQSANEGAVVANTLSLSTRAVSPSSDVVFVSAETDPVGMLTNRLTNLQSAQRKLQSLSSVEHQTSRLDFIQQMRQQARSREFENGGSKLYDRAIFELFGTDRFDDRRHEDDSSGHHFVELLRYSTEELDEREAVLAALGEEIDWHL